MDDKIIDKVETINDIADEVIANEVFVDEILENNSDEIISIMSALTRLTRMVMKLLRKLRMILFTSYKKLMSLMVSLVMKHWIKSWM